MENEIFSINIDTSTLDIAIQKVDNLNDKLLKLGKGKDIFGDEKNAQKGEKTLKTQNKLLDVTISKLKTLKLLTLGGVGLLAGLPALIGGIGAFRSMSGSIQGATKSNNLGISAGEGSALGFAGKMRGISEDTLQRSLQSLTVALNDYEQYGNFASLGLNASELKNKNPVEALFETLKTMETSPLQEGLKREFINKLGIPFDDLRFILKEGTTDLEKFFKEGLGIYGKGNNNQALQNGERSLIRFGAILERINKQLGSKIAPVLSRILTRLTPSILKFGDAIAGILDKVFTKDNVEKAANGISQVVNFATNKLKEIFNNENITKMTSLVSQLITLFNKIADPLSKLFDALISYLPALIDFTTGVAKLFGKGIDDVKNQNYNTFSKFDNSRGVYDKSDKQAKKKNDVVITKSGQIIDTSPEDYLFATKNPNSLKGGNGGNVVNININNPSVRNDSDISKIANQTKRLFMGLQTGAY